MFHFLTKCLAKSSMVSVAPTCFEFTASLRNSGWSLVWENGRLHYRESFPPLSLFPAPDEKRDELGFTIEPTAEQWARFWETLDQLNSWSWSGDYAWDYGVQMRGGQRWKLSLDYEGRFIRCAGNNRQRVIPPHFMDFLAALIELGGEHLDGATRLLDFLLEHEE